MSSLAALVLGACETDVESLGNAHTGGVMDASVRDAGHPDGMGCTLTHGFWKNHPEDWPVTELMLGGRTYGQDALLALLRAPVRGDATIILAHQLIAAKLNVAAGASGIPAIGEADAWIDARDDVGALPLGIGPSTDAGKIAVQLANALGAFNQGSTGPGHCPDEGPVECEPGLTNCGGVCVDTSSDESHCGGCRSQNVCFPGKVCIGGACFFRDAGAPRVDSGTPRVDSGAPGVDSGAPQVDAGAPSVDSGTPQVDAGAPEIDAGAPEIDAGAPEIDAGAPEIDAGTPAMDAGIPGVDAGAPGQDAGTPPTCGDVVCGANMRCTTIPGNFQICVCVDGWLDCDSNASSGCETLDSTNSDCGACDNACSGDREHCFGRVDATGFGMDWECRTCPLERDDCDDLTSNGCEISLRDDDDCGACGNVCDPGEVCHQSACVGACPAPFTDCSGACRDLQNEGSNCGACGNACPSGMTCQAGACVACPTLTADCDGVPTNGCEASTRHIDTCGGCTGLCPTNDFCSFGQTPEERFCDAGRLFFCPDPFRDCDGLGPLPGVSLCDANLTTDTNCGACGNVCGPGFTCFERACVPSGP